MTHLFLTLAAGAVAADGPAPANTGPEFGKASPVGLLVVALLIVGTALLIRSMSRHLKKLPDTFDPEHPEPDQATDEGTLGAVDTPHGGEPGDRAHPYEPG
ncbi:hypothetical protein [Mycolicibacillus koreensis]|uniref:Uncharacterized protein n=1 Tax=Mycolicibacillus koreensis TaxID=1069220 RepID=A0A7I7SIK6_9MYCO|nr:hypothetical protein BHQ15_10210 [Mycolicibacillus koreensis]OSC27269.1 hypothetical protein B8W67_18155 [Mycolicibacillus koreensis]BBY56772.1 hypothetical protein MKOR_40230 [Mycolicibacillus koreensis]